MCVRTCVHIHDRDKQRQTDRQAGRQIDRDRQRKKERQTDRQTKADTDRQTPKTHRHRQAGSLGLNKSSYTKTAQSGLTTQASPFYTHSPLSHLCTPGIPNDERAPCHI